MTRQLLTNRLACRFCHLSLATDIVPPVRIAQRLGANAALMVMGGEGEAQGGQLILAAKIN